MINLYCKILDLLMVPKTHKVFLASLSLYILFPLPGMFSSGLISSWFQDSAQILSPLLISTEAHLSLLNKQHLEHMSPVGQISGHYIICFLCFILPFWTLTSLRARPVFSPLLVHKQAPCCTHGGLSNCMCEGTNK